MRRTFIALFATAALAMPALAASNPPNSPPQQQPQAQQQQPQAKQEQNGTPNQQMSNQQNVPPGSLSRDEIHQMQTALNNDGFKAGEPDGIWGPHTRQALQKFEQSKGIQSNNGQVTEDTLAQLGVNANQQGQGAQQPQQNGSGSQNNNSH